MENLQSLKLLIVEASKSNSSEVLLKIVEMIDRTTTETSIVEKYFYCVELTPISMRVLDGKTGELFSEFKDQNQHDLKRTMYHGSVIFINKLEQAI